MHSDASGKNVSIWTYNGTVPGPTIRVTEGDIVTIHFINNGSTPHTIHFHGDHSEVNDGAFPHLVPAYPSPKNTYTYNFTAEPSGLLMYHCHMTPTSQHIRMGMYGAVIVDPKAKQNQLQPAREFLLVMSGYDRSDETNMQPKFEPAFYPINGYFDVYSDHPLEVVRFYVINMGVTIPYSFHLHSATFKAYPSGLISNPPINAQSFSIGPGDAEIIEAKWKYPGTYLFHSHGLQEERGNMGKICITGSATPLTKSISMIDWQYQLQQELQQPIILPAGHGTTTPPHDNSPTNSSNNTISIVVNSSIPNRELYYAPSPSTVLNGTMVNWTNDDNVFHTVTSTESPSILDSGFMQPRKKFTFIFDAPGTYNYFCILHPHMTGRVIVR